MKRASQNMNKFVVKSGMTISYGIFGRFYPYHSQWYFIETEVDDKRVPQSTISGTFSIQMALQGRVPNEAMIRDLY